MTTTNELIPWLLALGISRVDQTLRAPSLVPDVIDNSGTSYLTQPPPFGGYYTVSEFPPDDTGGAPITIISVIPSRESLPGHMGGSYDDGSICFEVDPTGAVVNCCIGESYAGHTIATDLPIPTTLPELQELIVAFKATFLAFVEELEAT